jgi:glycosyltransferase involved in cell wall biosynthesis
VPRVTVCIPTYNRSSMLQGAIESALSQGYDDISVVVSDNASDDDTAFVVRSFSDPRLNYLRREVNTGMVDNVNFVMKLAETEFLVVLSDDDRLLPGGLALAVEALDRHPTAGIVHAAFDLIDGEGRTVRQRTSWNRGQTTDALEPGADFIRKNMPSTSSVCVPTALIRRSCLPDPPLDIDLMPQADLCLWLTIALDHDVMYLNSPAAAFRTHEGSYSTSWARSYDNGLYVYETEIVVRLRDTKLLWIDRHAERLEDPATLRRSVRDGSRGQLLDATYVEPSRRRALGALATAVRLQPDIVGSARTWRRLGGILVRGGMRPPNHTST